MKDRKKGKWKDIANFSTLDDEKNSKKFVEIARNSEYINLSIYLLTTPHKPSAAAIWWRNGSARHPAELGGGTEAYITAEKSLLQAKTNDPIRVGDSHTQTKQPKREIEGIMVIKM